LFSARGTINFLEVSAQLGILAVAVTLLMIGGEFDLSLGSMIALAGVIIAIPATTLGWPIWVCIRSPSARRSSSAISMGWSWSAPACRRSS
jgi:simple sugar transport system permease protein